MRQTHVFVKPRRRTASDASAFTRMDLLAVLMTLALITALAFPLLANTRPRSDRVTCLNNLRQFGLGFRIYANAHGDQMPWALPNTDGGLRYRTGQYSALNPYVNFYWISNELGNPRILACPADVGKRVANDWRQFDSAAWRNNALSYFASMHADEKNPKSLLAGDRNLGNIPSTSCLLVAVARSLSDSPTMIWTNGIHAAQGNLLFSDGRARQTTSAGLRQAARENEPNSNNWVHVILP